MVNFPKYNNATYINEDILALHDNDFNIVLPKDKRSTNSLTGTWYTNADLKLVVDNDDIYQYQNNIFCRWRLHSQ